MKAKYDFDKMKNGFNTLPNGEEVFYISNPALGLWAHKDRFNKNLIKITNTTNRKQIYTMTKKADIGLIGLAVMGENLVLNMESKGFTVAVYNRTVEKVDNFVNGRGAGKKFIGAHSIEELVHRSKASTQSYDVGKSW
jgi:hypothetical protein